MAKKVFTDESLQVFVDKIKSYVDENISTKANTSHTHTISNITNLQSALDGKVSVNRTVNGKSLSSNVSLTANDVGADTKGSADSALVSAKSYTDTKISALINSAPTTLDTLGEIATAMEENADIVLALENAIGTKANTSDLTSHINNKSNPHSVTKTQIGLGNVENKSSATIRGELTKLNITTALGYTPPTTNTTYGVATSSVLGLIKSGTDITVDSNGNVSINDDSHNHTIDNIDNLQTSLDAKQATVTGGASTITSSNLTTNRALVSDASGKVVVSAVTSTELGYLDGVTSAIQTQLDGKAASSHGNHVPATQTANNAKFLRNDNTWQTVTPANIGAATSGHTHNNINMQNMSNKDLNTLKTQGWYYGYTGMTNAPAQAISVMEVLVYSQDWIVQRFTVVGATPITYERHYHSGNTWGSWFTNINSGNISSQSVASATKATQDASGNVITSTYETKANAASKLTEAKTYTDTVASGKANSSHTHSYAGSSSVGGSATSAVKLDTSTAGDANTPVYFSGGKPVACTSLDLNTSGNAATATNVAWSGVTSKPSYYDAKAIKGITRSGTTFTYTCMDGTTGTFTQQDNNTTYSVATTSANGLMSSTDKTKLNAMELATLAEVENYLGI